MATKTLPEGKELSVEEHVVGPLIRAALLAAQRDLRGAQVRTRTTPVYRIAGGVTRTEGVEMPSYFRTFPGSDSSAITSPEASALTDYLWSRGQPKRTLSCDGEVVPTKAGWSSVVWHELILRTIWYLADRAVAEDMALGQEHEPWRLDAADVNDAVAELVGLLSPGDLIVTAVCPVRACRFPDEGEAFELEPGVSLEPWRGGPNQTVFLTRFQGEYLPDDDVLWNAHAALRVRLKLPATVDAIGSVGSVLDRFLWAATLAGGGGSAVSLGSAVLRSATRHVRTVIHHPPAAWMTSTVNQIGWTEVRVMQGVHPDVQFLERAKDLLATLRRASSAKVDLDAAIWAFGRSCYAQTPRDVVLEAAIGLERLLVPEGRGDFSYKFRLHGAAMIAEQPSAFDDLNRVYDLRSKAAHGAAAKDPNGFVEMAPRARSLLARTIRSVAELTNKGDLVITKDQNVAAAIATLVRRRLTA